MGHTFMLVIAGLYLCAGISYTIDRNWPMALVSLCYGAANIGLVWLARRAGL